MDARTTLKIDVGQLHVAAGRSAVSSSGAAAAPLSPVATSKLDIAQAATRVAADRLHRKADRKVATRAVRQSGALKEGPAALHQQDQEAVGTYNQGGGRAMPAVRPQVASGGTQTV